MTTTTSGGDMTDVTTRPAMTGSRPATALLLALLTAVLIAAGAPFASAAPPSENTGSSQRVPTPANPGLVSLSCSEVFGISVSTTAPLSQKHCDALEAIYYGTGGPNWTYDWHPGQVAVTDPCSWSGVWCDDQVGVFRLELSYNNLVGALPAEIGDLGNLTWLSIYSNSLTSLPSSIGNLDKLVRLAATQNQLTSLPAQIGSLPALETLFLSNNQLTALPNDIANLANLRILTLDGNALTSLPAGLTNLTSLTELSAGNNSLSVLPALPPANLEVLYLDANNLGGSIAPILNTLVAYPALSRVGLGNNNLSGQVPGAVATMPLAYLEMSGNGCLTADAATTSFLSTVASFTGTADDALNVGCVNKFTKEYIEYNPFIIPGEEVGRVGSPRLIRR